MGQPIVYDISGALVPTETDEAMARDALIKAFHECPRAPHNFINMPNCNCDLGAIDGCKVRVRLISEAIAIARRM